MKVSDLQIKANLYPIEPNKIGSKPVSPAEKENAIKSGEVKPFAEVLQDKISGDNQVKFSAHAVKRLEERAVNLNEQELNRLQSGFKQLDAKGSKTSLIFVDDTAYIVSVKNKTVVTALKNAEAMNNVFTNIDSVAIV